MTKKVLVTGASGFVGANLVRYLLDRGHEVFAVVRDPSEAARLEDIANQITVRSAEDGTWIKEARFDWVFHLAASGAYSWQNQTVEMVDTNVRFTAQLLQWTESAEAFINSGSSSEYGYKDHPAKETDWPEPNSVYSATKLGATALCQEAGRRLNRPTLTARLYSVYGPYEDPRRLIATVIREGLEGRLPPLADPNTARDYIHVDDVCEALCLLAEKKGTDPGGIYNIGTGKQTSIADVVTAARKLMSIEAAPEWGTMANRKWDTNCWVADCSKMKEAFDWSASMDFETGLAKTVEWFRHHKDLLKN